MEHTLGFGKRVRESERGRIYCDVLIDGVKVGELGGKTNNRYYVCDPYLEDVGLSVHESTIKNAKRALRECFAGLLDSGRRIELDASAGGTVVVNDTPPPAARASLSKDAIRNLMNVARESKRLAGMIEAVKTQISERYEEEMEEVLLYLSDSSTAIEVFLRDSEVPLPSHSVTTDADGVEIGNRSAQMHLDGLVDSLRSIRVFAADMEVGERQLISIHLDVADGMTLTPQGDTLQDALRMAAEMAVDHAWPVAYGREYGTEKRRWKEGTGKQESDLPGPGP